MTYPPAGPGPYHQPGHPSGPPATGMPPAPRTAPASGMPMPAPTPPVSGAPSGYPQDAYAPTSPSYPPPYPPGAPYSGAMPAGPPPPMPGGPEGPRRKGRGATIAAGVLAVVAAVVLVGTLVLVATGTFNEDDPNPPPSANAQKPDDEPTTKATGPVVQPAGAPYSYRVPNGFQKTDDVSVSRGGQGAKYQSGVLPGGVPGEDLVAVTVYELPVDSSTLSDEQIRQELDRLVTNLADNGATEPETDTIAGARSWKYQVNVNDTVADSYFLFAGKTELQILCQWKTKQAEIQRGCQEVLDTLEITPTQ